MGKKSNMIWLALIATLIGWGGQLHGQQRMQYSQYLWNGYLMNPAFAGIEDYIDVRSGYSHQWATFDGAPRGIYVTGHTALKTKPRSLESETVTSLPAPGRVRYRPTVKMVEGPEASSSNPAFKMGVGGNLYAERIGPISYNGIGASFASNLRLKDELRLAIGVNLELLNFRLDPNQVTLTNGNDIAVANNLTNLFLPSVNAGFALYNKRFFISGSSRQLLQNRIQVNEANPYISGLEVHYWLHGGLRFQVSEDLRLMPSAVFRYVSPAPPSVDIGLQADIQNFLVLGASYRHKDALVGLIGINLNDILTLNYSYDFTTSNLGSQSAGTHGISLGLRLGNDGNTERRFFW